LLLESILIGEALDQLGVDLHLRRRECRRRLADRRRPRRRS